MAERVALSIAGSDPSGGAGIQADLKTFAAHEIFGTTAISAITVQNTTSVEEVVPLDPRLVAAQVTAVVNDMEVSAVKTGMLATPEIISTVADLARSGLLANLVVDPVLYSSTGGSLMAEGGIRAYRELLFPFATVLTPNVFEAAQLTARPLDQLTTTEEIEEAARELLSLGAQHVVVTGGPFQIESDVHMTDRGTRSEESMDVLVGHDGSTILRSRLVSTLNDHGTGCSFSAAIAAHLANGAEVQEAVRSAKAFVRTALWSARSWHIGSGRGPIDHLAGSDRRRVNIR